MNIGLFFDSILELFRRSFRSIAGFAANHAFISILILVSILSLVFLLASAVQPYSNAPETSAFSDEYRGYSYFYSLASKSHPMRVMYDFSSFNSLDKKSTLVIIGAQKPYSNSEANQIKSFVRNGGSLILFENAQEGSLAKSFGINFINATVIDKIRFIKREDFPVASFNLSWQSGFVATKFPSAINRTSILADAILETSADSWIDSNGNMAIDDNDTGGIFALGLKMKIGNGTLMLIGDPNAVSNDLIWMEDNSAFAEYLLEDANKGNAMIIFDESHKQGALESMTDASLKSLKSLSMPQTLMPIVISLIIIAGALWFFARREKKPAGKNRRYQSLVQDISSQILVRNEPYAWMVIIIYQRLRSILMRHVDPFEREGITNAKLAAWVAKDVPSLDSAFLEKLLNRCEEIENGKHVLNSFDESQVLCNNLMVCIKELGAEKWKPKTR
ncbi:MAG: DUF4350 domain-containing protein [Candidatus Micrarchaeota archaeon]|nr:DUF4350 domain-containing protein [Candidatus Micrarchaeota archaeon]